MYKMFTFLFWKFKKTNKQKNKKKTNNLIEKEKLQFVS